LYSVNKCADIYTMEDPREKIHKILAFQAINSIFKPQHKQIYNHFGFIVN
jgi:hypothetical protein